MKKLLFLFFILLCPMLCLCSRGIRQTDEQPVNDTIRAGIVYGPTSYFIYRGEELGFDYENLKEFAKENNKVLDLKVVSSLTSLLHLVESGEIDLAAYPIPYIEEYKEKINFCGPKETTWQVLVQKKRGDKITDVTDLIGKEVVVEKDSKFHYRLENLDKELGGGIIIKTIDSDSLKTTDLLDMVESGQIPITITDSDIAAVNSDFYRDLDMTLKVSLDQNASWAVSKGNEALKKLIDNWQNSVKETELQRNIYRKYFEYSINGEPTEGYTNIESYLKSNPGRISPYDDIFKKYAPLSGYDWKLLAAVGFNESRFSPEITSRYGAKGVMQIMDVAARSVKETPDMLTDPDKNIRTGAKVLKLLDDKMAPLVKDPEERLKFVLAAYNSGLGHIYDAIALAEKYDLNPEKWNGNVSEAALMKSKPEYYNDPVVKNGYFRAKETVSFVEKVMQTYNLINKKVNS